ncbi:MAG TPA: hypothetical protein VFM05_10350 [Candidatus Saccharimonadales bacterium]|nr:hypothetical protein [Candidatus Saccharimonadales bacterium]
MISSVIKNQQAKRFIEVTLTIMLLFLLFSLGGVPVILLSTSPLFLNRGVEREAIEPSDVAA